MDYLNRLSRITVFSLWILVAAAIGVGSGSIVGNGFSPTEVYACQNDTCSPHGGDCHATGFTMNCDELEDGGCEHTDCDEDQVGEA